MREKPAAAARPTSAWSDRELKRRRIIAHYRRLAAGHFLARRITPARRVP